MQRTPSRIAEFLKDLCILTVASYIISVLLMAAAAAVNCNISDVPTADVLLGEKTIGRALMLIFVGPAIETLLFVRIPYLALKRLGACTPILIAGTITIIFALFHYLSAMHMAFGASFGLVYGVFLAARHDRLDYATAVIFVSHAARNAVAHVSG